MGFACAALVHKHEVAMLTYLREFRCEAERIFGRGGAGSAGKVKERIGLALFAGRGQDEDVQTTESCSRWGERPNCFRRYSRILQSELSTKPDLGESVEDFI